MVPTRRLNIVHLGLLALLSGLLPAALRAQVATDGTLGPALDLVGPDYVIPADLGTQHGGNLFHSFEDFNLHTVGGVSESATFTPEGAVVPPSTNLHPTR